jgi:hypothetical protein
VKRRKTGDVGPNEIDLEQEEHSLSLSQHSSPSQSDQEQNAAQKLSGSPRGSISGLQPFVRLNSNGSLRTTGGGMSARPLKTDQFIRNIAPQQRHEMQFLTAEPKQHLRPSGPSLVCLFLFHNTSLCCHIIMFLTPILSWLFYLQIGAEVQGTIDGAFDSGYLMTAVVNGQLFRGVLFAPVSISIWELMANDA